jgi:hypothetical protein
MVTKVTKLFAIVGALIAGGLGFTLPSLTLELTEATRTAN